jgi:CheY-like chemotaxis protein
MRLLLVEDKIDFARTVEQRLRATIPQCETVWAGSRDAALREVAFSEHFDLVILDRRIPTSDGVLDDHAEHGWSVFQSVREKSLGTPVWFLTGNEDPDFAADLNNALARSGDLHGQRTHEPMYKVFWKRRIADCLREIAAFAAQRQSLDEIAIQFGAEPLPATPEENRTIRLFVRRHGGASVMVTSLNGGFSNSRVLKVVARHADGRAIITAAAKVSELAEIRAEEDRYRTEISRLTPGGFPQLCDTIDAGAGNTGGLFYGMVGDDVESLFDRIAANHPKLSQIPGEIQDILRPWYAAKRIEEVQVSRIRRRLIGDADLQRHRHELGGIDIASIENHAVTAAICCQHGDLHCANVVFDGRGRAMLIDFGDTGESFASVDPVTLELSTVFHSQHARLPAGWPGEKDMLAWGTTRDFTANCRFGDFVTACRSWAGGVAGSPEEVIAVAYAFAMRQLKYKDTDKVLARALIRSCVAGLVSVKPD